MIINSHNWLIHNFNKKQSEHSFKTVKEKKKKKKNLRNRSEPSETKLGGFDRITSLLFVV